MEFLLVGTAVGRHEAVGQDQDVEPARNRGRRRAAADQLGGSRRPPALGELDSAGLGEAAHVRGQLQLDVSCA